MTVRTLLVVLLAIICGASAAVGANVYLKSKSAEPAKPKTTTVLVAAVDMPRGTTLKEELIKPSEWPADMVPEGTVTVPEEALERALVTSMVAGEPILALKLADPGLLGAAALIEAGLRAYTINTPSPSSGVAGFLLPGNHVDVLLTMEDDDSDLGKVTKTLLHNVEILAAGKRLNTTKDSSGQVEESRSVTLLVTPEQARKLTLAQDVGTLNLTLRNDLDKSEDDAGLLSVKELLLLPGESGATEVVEKNEQAPQPQVIQPQPAPATLFFLRGRTSSVLRSVAAGTRSISTENGGEVN
jgi:pilus assembly protein CpaB